MSGEKRGEGPANQEERKIHKSKSTRSRETEGGGSGKSGEKAER